MVKERTSVRMQGQIKRMSEHLGGQAFDVLIYIKRSPSRVTRCRKSLSLFDRSRSCRTPLLLLVTDIG